MMDQVYVYGAGGHGKVVADILLSAGTELAGFIDDGRPAGAALISSIRVVGGREWIASNASRYSIRVALGIGDNAIRRKIAEYCAGLGFELVTAIHPSAIVSRFAQIDSGAVVMAGAIISPGATIRRGAVVNTAAVIDHDAIVEEFAQVMPNATMAGGTHLGAEASLGTGASMIPAVRVGAGSIVGAGAVVVRDIPDQVVAVGVPAVVRRFQT